MKIYRTGLVRRKRIDTTRKTVNDYLLESVVTTKYAKQLEDSKRMRTQTAIQSTDQNSLTSKVKALKVSESSEYFLGNNELREDDSAC